jgi:hypothetical protein
VLTMSAEESVDIGTWLHGFGLQQYKKVFRDNAADVQFNQKPITRKSAKFEPNFAVGLRLLSKPCWPRICQLMADEPASQGTRVSRMKKFHPNAGNSDVQLLRSTYSGTLQYTHSKFANRTAAVTRNTQRTPKAAATAPPESGPIELPRNIAEAVMP